MNKSSEYQFPIFISSTDYNLIDLRAELSHFLTDIGYRPILSSSEGFHDKSPDLEPWESCLPVLDSCFVMILIIDGKYGTGLPWPNFPHIPKINSTNRKYVSATHGEYLNAHHNKQRMLVFVRREVMIHYQSYRTALKNSKNKDEAKKALKVTLPKTINFETLDFLNEVKTSKPIPWIKEFDDVTTVKKEVHKKMLNELAEVFMMKDKHLETIVKLFNKAMDEVSPKKQDEILEKVNAIKGLNSIKKELEKKQKELEKEKAKNRSSADKDGKIKELEEQIEQLENRIEDDEISDFSNNFLVKSNGKLRINRENLMPIDTHIYGNINSMYLPNKTSWNLNECDECGKEVETDPFSLENKNLTRCYSCGKEYCEECWPQSGYISYMNKCPKCRNT